MFIYLNKLYRYTIIKTINNSNNKYMSKIYEFVIDVRIK